MTCINRGLSNNEGWCAKDELDGPKYRRSKICLPSAETKFFSITTVYMDSADDYKSQYHSHPYGEINRVITLDEEGVLQGISGYQGAG
jgi:hypothetical protein